MKPGLLHTKRMNTNDKRSQIMRAVRSNKNKSTELAIIKIFKFFKIKGWRRNYKIFGKPDFVFPKKRVVIFVDGCFWHGHNCRNIRPISNATYWENKLKRNKKRDLIVTKTLSEKQWRVIRIWECALKSSEKLPAKLKPYLRELQNK